MIRGLGATIRRVAGALALGGVLLCGSAQADTIYLWGEADPIEGEILEVEEDFYKIKKSDGVIVRIERVKVRRIVSAGEEDAARKAVEDRLAREAAERAKLLSQPMPPTRAAPAGGWLMLYDRKRKDEKGKYLAIGYRHYELKPSRDGKHFVFTHTEFQLNEHGRPFVLGTMTQRYDQNLRSRGQASRVVARGQRVRSDDTTEILRLGGGKIRLELKRASGPSEFEPYEVEVPGRTQFPEQLMVRLLHGKLLMDLMESRVTTVPPNAIPNRAVLRMRGDLPEGQKWPLTGRLEVDMAKTAKRSEKNVDGYTQFVVTLRESYPGTRIPGTAQRITFGVLPGKPIRVLSMMVSRQPIAARSDINEVRRSRVWDSVPPEWKRVTPPPAPEGLGDKPR